jgi:perosamine synthetase
MRRNKLGMIQIPQASLMKFKSNFESIVASGNLAEGLWNKKLNDFFVNYTGVKNSISFASNGSGILAILMLLKKYRGYENIFIQSNTMYGVKTMAITSGLKFIGFVDCNISSLMPSINQFESFVNKLSNPSKSVFLISHIGGIINPDIKEISELCQRKKIALVEDCAHSLGATLNSEHSGVFGLAGVYSLYATKAVPAGEGGIAITNDEELALMLQKFNIYDRFDQKQEIGVNFRISEIQALFSYCVCEQTENIIANKEKIAKRYMDICDLNNVNYINQKNNGNRGNYYKFILLFNKSIQEDFKSIDVKTSSVYDYALGDDKEDIVSRHLCLPIWYNLDSTIVDKVIKIIPNLK